MKHLTTFRLIDAIARTGSIRSAAEQVAQTPSAVQRRLQAYEDELGYQIFDRSPGGVRLNAAGELVIQHIREVLADTVRLRSRIADLSGNRRGHVSIGCSQALVPYFLPARIAAYQSEFPLVTFDVQVLEHRTASEALEDFSVDAVLVFSDGAVPDYEVILTVPQTLTAVMSRDHPLAQRKTLRLWQCYDFPIAAPNHGFGGRTLLNRSLYDKTFARAPVLETNSFEYLKAHVAMTDAISFQIQIGSPGLETAGPIVSRPIDPRDVPGGMLLLGQKRGRNLSVAASRFVEDVRRQLVTDYGSV